MFCFERTAVGETDGRGIAASLRCKLWSCAECVEINKAKIAALVRELDPTHFCTFTTCPHGLATPAERAKQITKSWSLIRRRLRRKYPTAKFDFLAKFEATQRGEPHLHVGLKDCPIAPDEMQKLMSSWMEELTGAPNVDVRLVYDVNGLACYLRKDPHLFAGSRRYWTSNGWRSALGVDVFKLHGVIAAPLAEVERRAVAQGHIVLDRSPLRFVTERPLASQNGD